jgi:hypothetical protein
VVGKFQHIADDGTMYVTHAGKLQIWRGDSMTSFGLRGGGSIAVADNGQRLATIRNNYVVVVDSKGNDVWQAPLWNAVQALFVKDDTALVVRTRGGLVTFDAATGERLAAECGWGFGLTSEVQTLVTMEAEPVCEPTL